MKHLVLFSSVLLLFFVTSFISCKEVNNKDGIKFFEGTWEQVLQKAKTEQKPIFLDIYASWCGPCKMLKNETFPDKEAGDYFNARFINVSVDGEVGEGPALAAKFGITGYPTLIILDKDGTVLSTQTGYLTPSELVTYGKQTAGN